MKKFKIKAVLRSFLFVFFVSTASLPLFAYCESGTDYSVHYAVHDGRCMAYYCKDYNDPYWLGGGGDNCGDQECEVGTNQYKASGECDTLERTCCKNGFFSEWGKECDPSSNCSSNQCWNGSSCVSKPTQQCSCSNGTCTRTYTCNTGTGWTYKDSTCKCNSGYSYINGSCQDCIRRSSPTFSVNNCMECWNKALSITNSSSYRQCTSDNDINCYVKVNSSVTSGTPYNCTSSKTKYGVQTGGSTPILTMRYTEGANGRYTFCIMESMQYRWCR